MAVDACAVNLVSRAALEVVATAVFFFRASRWRGAPAAGAQALRGTLQHDERRKTAFMCESSEAQVKETCFLRWCRAERRHGEQEGEQRRASHIVAAAFTI